jgi:hypothetical protein
MSGIFVLRDGALVEMTERPYLTESVLQDYLAAHPELLSAEAPEDERRGWLLVKREKGVADRANGGDRWSLDHLFVDQDAIPTFVEVKRSSDTRLRREVVGQMLDYAANASLYWGADELQSSFLSRFPSRDEANDELTAFLDGDVDPETFWEAVASNLRDRQLRLVFVADDIPLELRNVVEFLNEQLRQTEVIAVEVKQYSSPAGDQINVVPRVIGETEMARRVKAKPAQRRRATEEDFYRLMRSAYEPALAERVLGLYEYAKGNGSRTRFGRGTTPSTTVWMGEHDDPNVANPLALTFWGDGGGIAVNLKYVRWRRSPEEMERLMCLLRRLRGADPVIDQAIAKEYRTFCTLQAAEVLATDEDLETFKAVLSEASKRGP